jgi:hypothetical protein
MSDSSDEWQLNQIVYADDAALVVDEKYGLHRQVSEFGRVCERRKVSVNVAKGKVMMVTRKGIVGDIATFLNIRN